MPLTIPKKKKKTYNNKDKLKYIKLGLSLDMETTYQLSPQFILINRAVKRVGETSKSVHDN